MSSDRTDVDYANDARHHREYAHYQTKYADYPRESDLKIIKTLAARFQQGYDEKLSRQQRVLELGCSQGNFLRHLRNLCQVSCTGMDLNEVEIEIAAKNPTNADIEFLVGDISVRDQYPTGRFDVIVANAVFGALDDICLTQALRAASSKLAKNGCLMIFDWIHKYPHNLQVTETFLDQRELRRLTWNSRNLDWYQEIISIELGSVTFEYTPFYVSAELPLNPNDLIQTRTLEDSDSLLQSMRGSFLQPWAHLTASVER